MLDTLTKKPALNPTSWDDLADDPRIEDLILAARELKAAALACEQAWERREDLAKWPSPFSAEYPPQEHIDHCEAVERLREAQDDVFRAIMMTDEI